MLAGVGYAGVKLAPKFAKLGDDALKLTDDVAKKFDDAYQATKGKIADLANKVDDALSPGMVTTEGVVIKQGQIKGSNVFESRAVKQPNGRRNIDSHETLKSEKGVIVGKKKGHTIEKHVDKSEAYLKERLAIESNIKSASTFFNKEIGNRVQLSFLRRYKSEINTWLKSSNTKPFVREFEMPIDVGRVKGRGKASSVQTTNKVRVVVIKDESPKGWRFETSFPIPR